MIGAPVPQLGSERRRGGGLARGRGRRVRPLGLRPAGGDRGRSRTSSSTTTPSTRRSPSSSRRSPRGRRARDVVVRDAPPFDGELAVAGRATTGATRARRSRRSSAAGVPRDEAAPVLARFTGTGRRFEVSEAGGVTIVDDYGHHPSELAATIAAIREAYPGRRLHVLFQPHLYSRTRHLAGELGAALAAADDVAVTDVYPAREAAGRGRDRQARRRRALGPRRARGVDADGRAGRDVPRAGAPSRRRAARDRRRRHRPRAGAAARERLA